MNNKEPLGLDGEGLRKVSADDIESVSVAPDRQSFLVKTRGTAHALPAYMTEANYRLLQGRLSVADVARARAVLTAGSALVDKLQERRERDDDTPGRPFKPR